jgi:DNA-binding beta-propeller fold protein YncE
VNHVAGGDIAPSRYISDPHATFDGIALDVPNNQVWMSDSNRMRLLSYDRRTAANPKEPAQPLRQIRGPATGMMFIAGVAVDSRRREVYTLDNDIGDRMMVFPYDAEGNVKPKRVLHVPHQAWGISLNQQRDEVAISVQSTNQVLVYPREAKGEAAPLRVLRGPNTGLADPHGVVFDATNNELVVSNHGNWTRSGRTVVRSDDRSNAGATAVSPGGRFEEPSIRTYAIEAKGDTRPLRTIQGTQTRLNWPMGIDVDTSHDEIAVANSGDNSVLVFQRSGNGNVAPVRVIRGNRTGITGPIGIAVDATNDELWVANYSDHTALIFARTANGNVAPKRILRNAPAGSPTLGFTNPGAVAYDSKRGQILVPN